MKRIALACVIVLGGVLVAVAQGMGGPFGGGGGGVSAGFISGLYCALAGCAMTGGTTYSAVATDITTGAGEDLTAQPGTTGRVQLVKTAEAGVAEKHLRLSVSDDASSSFMVVNGTATDTDFAPHVKTFLGGAAGDTSRDITSTTAALDTGAAALRITQWFRATDENTATAVIATRPLWNWVNYTTTILTVFADGSWQLGSGVTKTRGTITLSGGTGTATVNTGAICVCTDTTANASVKCAVSSTTLTATGTTTDVIAYICL